MIKIKNWSSYQSYKDRKPPWIRFHRTMLDNYDFHMMSVEARALLPMLWLLASEDDDPTSGVIKDDCKKIAFRLRQTEKQIIEAILECKKSGFLEVTEKQRCIDSVHESLRDRNQTVTPETETETDISLSKLRDCPEVKTSERLFKKLNPKELDADWKQKPLPPDNVIEMWNEVIVGEENTKNHIRVTAKRKQDINRRSRDSLFTGEDWLDYFRRIREDSFCMGEKGWKANIDWALKPSSITKMLEGGYSGG